MSSTRNIPENPNLERDKKEAKLLKKALQTGERKAAQRVIDSHPAFQKKSIDSVLSTKLNLRDLQLVIAREYGFDSWFAWKEYVESVSGAPEIKAYKKASWAIKYKKHELLTEIIEKNPQLTKQKGPEGGFLLEETLSYANDPGEFMAMWTSTDCAQVLVKNGARVTPGIYIRALETADSDMVEMFFNEKAIADTLRTAAAIGNIDHVKQFFDENGKLKASAHDFGETGDEAHRWPDASDPKLVIADAFRFAIRHSQKLVAPYLYDRYKDLEPDEIEKLEKWKSKADFIDFAIQRSINVNECVTIFDFALRLRLEEAFKEENLNQFIELLDQFPEILSEKNERLQLDILEHCGYMKKADVARALLSRGASVVKTKPKTKALLYAIDYGDREMISLLRKVWEPEDNLPTQAGLGDIEKVKSFFDKDGKVIPSKVLCYPEESETDSVDSILLHALGLALMNEQFEIAEFLIEHGANINGAWGLHEPASLLHEMAGNGKFSSVKFLVDHGADVTIRDERYGAMPYDWAEYMGQTEVLEYLKPLSIESSFWAAVRLGTLEDVIEHVKNGADVNEAVDFIQAQEISVLFNAVDRGEREIIDYLLENGADASHLDSNRKGALHRINVDGEDAIAIAKSLIEHGCDINYVSNDFGTPLDHARKHQLKDLEQFLISRGAVSQIHQE